MLQFLSSLQPTKFFKVKQMRYRRVKITGGTYFFTLNLAERKKTLLIDHIDILRNILNTVKKRHPFKVDAMVILPDHLHALTTPFPKGRGFLIQHNEPMQINYRGFTVAPKAKTESPSAFTLIAALMSRSCLVRRLE